MPDGQTHTPYSQNSHTAYDMTYFYQHFLKSFYRHKLRKIFWGGALTILNLDITRVWDMFYQKFWGVP